MLCICALLPNILVLGANNPGYRSVISDAFAHITGQKMEFHAVLKGSMEEKSALEEAKKQSPGEKNVELPPKSSSDAPTEDYQLLSPEELDRNNRQVARVIGT